MSHCEKVAFCTRKRVDVVDGARGRRASDIECPLHELVDVKVALTEYADEDPMPHQDVQKLIADILNARDSMVATHGGHSFDAKGGSVLLVTVDCDSNVHTMVAHVYWPTSAGGPILFKTRDEFVEICSKTFNHMDDATADDTELRVRLSAFENHPVLFMYPEPFHHPAVVTGLGLRKLSAMSTVVADVRVCDGKGLGKSAPRLSNGKWKVCFPGVPIDMSHVKKKTAADGTTPSRKRSIADVDTSGSSLIDKIRRYVNDMNTPGTENISMLHCTVVVAYLRRFGDVFGSEKFDITFAPYDQMPVEMAWHHLLCRETMRQIAMVASEDDIDAVEKIMDTVDAMDAYLGFDPEYLP